MFELQKVWYSYKCRAENFRYITEFYVKIYDYVEYEDIRILNTIIVDEKDAFVWEFDSDRTLEELVDMIKTCNNDVREYGHLIHA